jgi:two-component system, NtrC family, response regulator HydG
MFEIFGAKSNYSGTRTNLGGRVNPFATSSPNTMLDTFNRPHEATGYDLLPRVPSILIADEESSTRQHINGHLDSALYDFSYVSDSSDVINLLNSRARAYEFIFVSVRPPLAQSLANIRTIKNLAPESTGVALIPQSESKVASEVLQVGAKSYLVKPLQASQLLKILERHFADAAAKTLARLSPPKLSSADDPLSSFIGSSPQMAKIFALIRKVAPSDVNVLVTGESGTGKEMVAAAIHKLSTRRDKPFVAINCAAIPKELLESELFGHAKGSFTGATVARRGLFEEADGGTVFLDEIGDLPLPLQAKILRLLQTREVKPVGQNSTIKVDVRIISATHKDLKLLISQNEFREDLYYRLNVMPLHLPALRERRPDIPLLAEFFLKKYANAKKLRVSGFSQAAMSKLMTLEWRGNVRELENTIERASVLAESNLIEERDIVCEDIQPTADTSSSQHIFERGLTLHELEMEYIKFVLKKTNNKKEAATRILGIDRKTLYRKEKQYLSNPDASNPQLST